MDILKIVGYGFAAALLLTFALIFVMHWRWHFGWLLSSTPFAIVLIIFVILICFVVAAMSHADIG